MVTNVSEAHTAPVFRAQFVEALLTWRLRQYEPRKCSFPLEILHGVTKQSEYWKFISERTLPRDLQTGPWLNTPAPTWTNPPLVFPIEGKGRDATTTRWRWVDHAQVTRKEALKLKKYDIQHSCHKFEMRKLATPVRDRTLSCHPTSSCLVFPWMRTAGGILKWMNSIVEENVWKSWGLSDCCCWFRNLCVLQIKNAWAKTETENPGDLQGPRQPLLP